MWRQQQQTQTSLQVLLPEPHHPDSSSSSILLAETPQQQQLQLQDDTTTLPLAVDNNQNNNNNKNIIQARWLLLAAAALYGTNFSLVKLLGEAHLPIGASSTLRFGMAALATLPWLLPTTTTTMKREETDTSHVPMSNSYYYTPQQVQATLLGLEVGLYNAIGYVAQAVGLETTAASKSAFLCSLAVVVVPFLDYTLKSKNISKQQIVGTLLAVVGVGVLELGDVSSLQQLSFSAGDVASLIQPLCFGLGFWKMEQAMQKVPEEANRSTAAQLMAVFLTSFLYSSIVEPGALDVAHVTEWLSNKQVLFGLFWTGCITTALTVYMETIALKTLSAAETTLIFSTEPIWGTAFAATVMGEQLGMDSAVGAVLILSGCLFSNLGLDGIKRLLIRSPAAAVQVDEANVSTQTREDSGVATTTRNGMSGMFSGLWTNFAVTTSAFAMDIEDKMDELMNKLEL